MFTNLLRTVVTEPLPQAGHWTHGACISPLPLFPPWAWVPIRARRTVLSAPGPGAPNRSSASPALGQSPWLPAPHPGGPVHGAVASALSSAFASQQGASQLSSLDSAGRHPVSLGHRVPCCPPAAMQPLWLESPPLPPSQALRPGRKDGVLPGEQWAAMSCLQGWRQGHPVSLSTHPGGLALPLCPLRLCVCVCLSVCLSVLAPPANRPLLGSCPFPHGLGL